MDKGAHPVVQQERLLRDLWYRGHLKKIDVLQRTSCVEKYPTACQWDAEALACDEQAAMYAVPFLIP